VYVILSQRSQRHAANRRNASVVIRLTSSKKEIFMQKQRRDFLKITAAGAAGLVFSRGDRAFAAWPSTGTLAVNPNISNMRVVGCVDTKMMKSTPAMSFAAENAAVDSARLQANMDAMAMQLANQPTADAAWKAIFSTGKSSWAATKVAIKINSLEPKNTAHIAILQKFCSILAGYGVLPANIIIYDGQSAYTDTSNFASYISLTDTTKIQAVLSNLNSAMGGTVSAAIPGGSTGTCTADIANGTIDILINVANNKGHDLMGGATLCMKNHFGTFAPKHDINYLFNINKSDAILGGTPVRQQLCFVDSLFTNKTQNVGTPELMPCYLTMGVFAPAVDYLTIKKVREEALGLTHVDATINSYLTSFGYTTADPVWVLVPPADSGSGADAGAGGSGGTSGAGGTGSGGTSAAGGARSGGTSGSGGVASGGTSGSGGAGNGGTSAGAGSGGTSAGAGSGGTSGSGGAGNGGTSAGARSGGSSGSGGAGSGGTTAAGGATGSGGTTSGGAGGTGGAATSSASASGGSATTGGTGAGGGTGGSGGSKGSTAGGGKQEGGCDVAGVDRRVTRWGTMLAFGAVVAEKLRRLVRGSDRSS
jgi:hypothetical protein